MAKKWLLLRSQPGALVARVWLDTSKTIPDPDYPPPYNATVPPVPDPEWVMEFRYPRNPPPGAGLTQAQWVAKVKAEVAEKVELRLAELTGRLDATGTALPEEGTEF